MSLIAEPDNASGQLRVDEAILDYLIFSATHKLIEKAKLVLANGMYPKMEALVELSLEMVDSFLISFGTIHPHHQCDAQLLFRLRLLKFVVLLESPSSSLHLHSLKPHWQDAQNDQDVTESKPSHISKPSSPPLSQSKLCIFTSLLDTLPHFMALSAAQLMLQGSHITDVWMKLAAGYMTHAVIEQCFAHGEHSMSVVQRAFAWGFDEQSTSAEGSDECQINAMFFDEEKDTQVGGWEKTRDDHRRALNPPNGVSLLPHLQKLIADELPPRHFERCLLEFLDNLHQGQPKPLLQQAGSGQIDGLSANDSGLFMLRLGIV